jgi:predicted NACHT family NTPase
LYAQLAYESFSKEKIFFTQTELEKNISIILKTLTMKSTSKEIDSSRILPKLVSQHGILSRRSYRTYAFSHLTFQEFYTAKYIVDNKLTNDLATHISDTRWREVFLLVASQE